MLDIDPEMLKNCGFVLDENRSSVEYKEIHFCGEEIGNPKKQVLNPGIYKDGSVEKKFVEYRSYQYYYWDNEE
jgi:hypothetical protein